MASQRKSNTAIGFVLGAVVVVVGGIVWYLYNGDSFSPHHKDNSITIELPSIKKGG